MVAMVSGRHGNREQVMEQTTLHTIDDTVATIEAQGYRRIGVDGNNGVGKTTIAREIGQRLQLPVISLDDYLENHGDGFVEFLRYPDLADAISGDEFVVEGVCLLEALSRVGGTVDVSVYVKRIEGGLWCDEDTCDVGPGEADDVIAREGERLQEFVRIEAEMYGAEQPGALPELSGLTRELIRYHAGFRPHERARIVHRVELG